MPSLAELKKQIKERENNYIVNLAIVKIKSKLEKLNNPNEREGQSKAFEGVNYDSINFKGNLKIFPETTESHQYRKDNIETEIGIEIELDDFLIEDSPIKRILEATKPAFTFDFILFKDKSFVFYHSQIYHKGKYGKELPEFYNLTDPEYHSLCQWFTLLIKKESKKDKKTSEKKEFNVGNNFSEENKDLISQELDRNPNILIDDLYEKFPQIEKNKIYHYYNLWFKIKEKEIGSEKINEK